MRTRTGSGPRARPTLPSDIIYVIIIIKDTYCIAVCAMKMHTGCERRNWMTRVGQETRMVSKAGVEILQAAHNRVRTVVVDVDKTWH